MSKFLVSEVSLYAMKFEDRSHEETERQERCAQSEPNEVPGADEETKSLLH